MLKLDKKVVEDSLTSSYLDVARRLSEGVDATDVLSTKLESLMELDAVVAHLILSLVDSFTVTGLNYNFETSQHRLSRLVLLESLLLMAHVYQRSSELSDNT